MWFKSRQQKVKEFCDSGHAETHGEFISGCHLASENADIGIGVRRVIARLASVDEHYIRHDDPFDGRIDLLPFWDSLDSLAIVIELQQELGVTINDAMASRIRNPEMSRGLTVADFVSDVVRVLRDSQKATGCSGPTSF